MVNVINNADRSARGWIHQFYVALEQCFSMRSGERIFIEVFGDVTTAKSQIEVKHEQKALTDYDHNLWKTIKNWLDSSFLTENYKSLILCTTQKLGSTSTLQNWNSKSADEKLVTLKNIQAKHSQNKNSSENTSSLMQFVLAEDKQIKLSEILGKFYIDSESDETIEIHQKIKEIHLNFLIETQRDKAVNQLLGFILEPHNPKSNWEISHDIWSARLQEISNDFSIHTRVFPNILTPADKQIQCENDSDKHLFIQKLEDIEHKNAVIPAIKHFVQYRSVIAELGRAYHLAQDTYDAYENEVIDGFQAELAKAQIETQDIDVESELTKQCQKFYSEVTSKVVQPFANFNNTPMYFRNGLIHELADDEQKPIIWRVK